jgi:hypothetical protein
LVEEIHLETGWRSDENNDSHRSQQGYSATVERYAGGVGNIRQARGGHSARSAGWRRHSHADCEAELLNDGSQQEDIWGADWFPKSQKVQFEALINIRPRQGNLSMEIQDSGIRSEVESIATELLGGVG